MATVTNQSPPTVVAIALSTAILGALGGFFLGQASSVGIFGGPKASPSGAQEDSDLEDEKDGDDEDDEDEDEVQEGLQSFDASSSFEECKLTLVVRTDLGMTKGIHQPFLWLTLKRLY